MRTEQLYYFLEAVKCGSFSKAAENLYIKQPSLREAINNLEAEIGAKLFITNSKGVKLTPYGQQCLPLFQRIIQTFESAKVTNCNSVNQYLKFGMDYYADNLLRKVPYNFSEKYSIIPAQNYIVYQDAAYLIKKLLADELDAVSFVASDFIPNLSPALEAKYNHDIDRQNIFTLPISIIINRGHPLFYNKELSLKDIEPFPLLSSSFLQYPLIQYFYSNGLKHKVYSTDSRYRFNRSILDNSISLEDHVLQYSADLSANPNNRYIDFTKHLPLKFCICYKKNTIHHQYINEFINIHQKYYLFKNTL